MLLSVPKIKILKAPTITPLLVSNEPVTPPAFEKCLRLIQKVVLSYLLVKF